jgi:hypothetical protein
MNKAKPDGGLPTKESQFYMREIQERLQQGGEGTANTGQVF